MSQLVIGEDRVVDENTDWYWQLTQPTDGADVELVLAPLFHDWDGEDLQLLIHTIAKKLQYTASLLLSNPITEEDDE